MQVQHSFSQVPSVSIPRSSFNRSHGHKTTFDAGYLIPVFVDEALPGDTFRLNPTLFGRLATPIVPIMDNLYLDSFYFAVPIRLLWNNFNKFMGEQADPDDSTDYLVPQMVSTAVTGYLAGSLHDHLGLPTEVPGLSHSSLWHRAYNLIWNEWFRDENLQDSLVVDKDDGPDLPTDYVLKRRGKRHDYFTSCLPWPQKADAVSLPLGTRANVIGFGPVSQVFPDDNVNVYETSGTSNVTHASGKYVDYSAVDNRFHVEEDPTNPGFPNIWADLSNATSATINALRQAIALQALYERDARGGTRYTEIIRSHFGVVSPDARLQRSEFLGGGSSKVTVNPIAQTSSTDGTSPQGNLAAMGIMMGSGQGFTKSFTEHCVIIGMVSLRAEMSYQQGLNRMFSRNTRWDFYWPGLVGIGEQEVYNKEIYAVGTGGATDGQVFGYQERYAEYKYKPSLITGQFRSNYATPLDHWHVGQDFTALPVLNGTFIEENPPIDRVIAVPSEPHVLFDSWFDLTCARPMPTYSVPGVGSKL